MRLLGIVSILIFLSFLVAILNLLLFYLLPFIYEVKCYLNDFLYQCIVRAGLIFIACLMIIASFLPESSIVSANKISAGYMTCELCRLDVNEEEFSVQEVKQEIVLKEKIYSIEIEVNDAYSKVDEEKRNVYEKDGVSGNNVNVKADHTSLEENPSGDEIKEKVEQEKMWGICVEDGEGNEDANILERRIEEFIARSHQRWKQELLEEKSTPMAIGNDTSYNLTKKLITEAQQREVMPRLSRPKDAKNKKSSKRQRLRTIRRLMESMQTKANMIQMSSKYAIMTENKRGKKFLINGI